jgi:hypothetical protein
VSGTTGALSGWTDAITADGGGFGDIVGPAVLAFPLLVLGLSGFETGVSMMPLVAADGTDVNAQAGAYATGILAMMVSGAFAVTVSAVRRRQRVAAGEFTVLTLVLLYALAENIREKPDGIAISAMFIAGIIAVSLISRAARTTELRADHIEFDDEAGRFVTHSIAHDGALNLIAKPSPHRRRPG